MMESLTQQLADAAMEIIEEVESIGGMTKAIESGMAKLRIEESATKKQARIDAKEETIVGVNKYRVESEKPIDVLSIDNAAVRASQTAKLQKLRAERDEVKVQAALSKLTEASKMAGGHPHYVQYNLFSKRWIVST